MIPPAIGRGSLVCASSTSRSNAPPNIVLVSRIGEAREDVATRVARLLFEFEYFGLSQYENMRGVLKDPLYPSNSGFPQQLPSRKQNHLDSLQVCRAQLK